MAAFEVEPATQSVYVNCWKEDKSLTPEVAGRRLRGAVTDAVQVGACLQILISVHLAVSRTTAECAVDRQLPHIACDCCVGCAKWVMIQALLASLFIATQQCWGHLDAVCSVVASEIKATHSRLVGHLSFAGCVSLRANTICMQGFQQQHAARPTHDILDVGCSVGVSTRWLAGAFPDADIVGADLSPYFLAVAELRER